MILHSTKHVYHVSHHVQYTVAVKILSEITNTSINILFPYN